MIGNYPFVYKNNGHQYEGFFPDIPDIKVNAKSVDEINNIAAQKLRIYLSMKASNIPSSSISNDIRNKYNGYGITSIIVGFDNLHNGKHELSEDVKNEFLSYLNNKDYKNVERYISLYYGKEEAFSSLFYAKIIEYYVFVKRNFNLACDVLSEYLRESSHANDYALPDLKVVEFFLQYDVYVDLAVLLSFFETNTSDKEILKKIYEYSIVLFDKYKNEDQRKHYEDLLSNLDEENKI